jgi:toxin ParE1/3/4
MNLIFSWHARRDLIDIWFTIAKDDPNVADRILAEIEAKCSLLQRHPYIGRARSELLPDLRSFPRRPFVIFYHVSGQNVEIVRVLDGRRDLKAVFTDPNL